MVTNQILRKPDVRQKTGLSLRTIDRLEAAGKFPRRFRISARCVGWDSASIQRWIDDRAAKGGRAADA